jgi:L-rhamnose mutarotase
MPRVAFIMKLHTGKEAEYRRRHDEIWPELSALLHDSGIREYSIFLEEGSGQLFACLNIAEPGKLDQLPQHPVMQRWWTHMKDIMDTNPDHSPVSIPLKEVFYLP